MIYLYPLFCYGSSAYLYMAEFNFVLVGSGNYLFIFHIVLYPSTKPDKYERARQQDDARAERRRQLHEERAAKRERDRVERQRIREARAAQRAAKRSTNQPSTPLENSVSPN